MKDIVSFSRILARPTNTCGCHILGVLQASDGQSLWMLLNTLLYVRQTSRTVGALPDARNAHISTNVLQYSLLAPCFCKVYLVEFHLGEGQDSDLVYMEGTIDCLFVKSRPGTE